MRQNLLVTKFRDTVRSGAQKCCMIDLVIATRNLHKIREIQNILGSGFRCFSMSELPEAPLLIEDGDTFAANATKKVVQLARWLTTQRYLKSETLDTEPLVLADDSGLEVDALNGAPGVHSARFAAVNRSVSGNSSDVENNAKLLRLLKDVPAEKRTARFRCVLALTRVPTTSAEFASPACFADEAELQTELFDGACEGHIAFERSGKGGFGYDPLFVPVGYSESFAELGEAVKNRLSHRARALGKLRERLREKN